MIIIGSPSHTRTHIYEISRVSGWLIRVTSSLPLSWVGLSPRKRKIYISVFLYMGWRDSLVPFYLSFSVCVIVRRRVSFPVLMCVQASARAFVYVECFRVCFNTLEAVRISRPFNESAASSSRWGLQRNCSVSVLFSFNPLLHKYLFTLFDVEPFASAFMARAAV